MNAAILLIAMTLGRPAGLVAQVYGSTPADPVLACSTVEWESRWEWKSIHVNSNGSRDWRYWQINDKYWNPYADNPTAHIKEGGKILTSFLKRAHGSPEEALHFWNSGKSYPAHVLAIYYKLKTKLVLIELMAKFNVMPSHGSEAFGKPAHLVDWMLTLFDNRRAKRIA